MKTTRRQARAGKVDWRHRVADARSVERRIAKLREEEPAAEEIAAIRRGSREFRQGGFIDLSELHHEHVARIEQREIRGGRRC